MLTTNSLMGTSSYYHPRSTNVKTSTEIHHPEPHRSKWQSWNLNPAFPLAQGFSMSALLAFWEQWLYWTLQSAQRHPCLWFLTFLLVPNFIVIGLCVPKIKGHTAILTHWVKGWGKAYILLSTLYICPFNPHNNPTEIDTVISIV